MTRPGPKPEPFLTRFWRQVRKTDTCWLWTGVSRNGYGRISVRRKNGSWRADTVTRVVWSLVRGPIPRGKLVLHTCDVPLCVRPDHLFLGTHQDNSNDKWRKGRGRTGRLVGENHPQATLDDRAVASIRKQYRQTTATQRELAAAYGVSLSTIDNIINRRERFA